MIVPKPPGRRFAHDTKSWGSQASKSACMPGMVRRASSER